MHREVQSRAEVFYDLRHQTIYEAFVQMYDKREPIDIITLQQRLKDRGLLDQVGVSLYLNALQDSVPSAANLELLPWLRGGKISSAENDPHLYGRGGPGL